MESINKFLRQFSFTFLEAKNNFKRSGWMSWIVVTTMATALSIFGGFWLLLNDFNYLAESVGSKLQIISFLKKDADLEKVFADVSKIEEVTNVVSIEKDEAWKNLKSDLKNNLELENIGNENPLPDSLQITVKDPESVEVVAEKLRSLNVMEEIKYSKELSKYIEDIRNLIRIVGLVISSVLGIATIAIIFNTIRLAVNSRKNEIEIMRLVGATNWFIRTPFLLEGIFFGILSSIFTAIILYIWRTFSLTQIQKLFPFIPVTSDYGVVWSIIVYILIISIVIGFIGSALSVHKYLKFEKV